MTKHRGQTAKGKSNTKSAPVRKAKTGYALPLGPVTPPPGSMLKKDGPKGTGRMR